ncbi:MAG: hypothetical protein DHS20C01_30450 [marine bacterium B5-7]|nr:MAG: hypothetical protein DHS20C01_30450 [marine bacterium B5-7]
MDAGCQIAKNEFYIKSLANGFKSPVIASEVNVHYPISNDSQHEIMKGMVKRYMANGFNDAYVNELHDRFGRHPFSSYIPGAKMLKIFLKSDVLIPPGSSGRAELWTAYRDRNGNLNSFHNRMEDIAFWYKFVLANEFRKYVPDK